MKTQKPITHLVLGGILAAGLLFATGKPALADRDWGPSCHDKLESARARLDRDASRHGENSSQVRHDQDRLEDARRWCRDHHADWDHNRFDIGIYFRH
jgi:hypothetical protein